jgi:uncharacterized protein YqeY
MAIVEQIEKDLVAAMKAKEELRLSVLRMAKAALMNKKIELGKPLEDAEALAVLRTLIKQRRDSVGSSARAGETIWLTRKKLRSRSLRVTYLPDQARKKSTLLWLRPYRRQAPLAPRIWAR